MWENQLLLKNSIFPSQITEMMKSPNGGVLDHFSAIFVFLGLYIILLLVYKILSWSSPEAQHIGRKIKLLIWGFITSFTLWWFLLDAPPSQSEQFRPHLVKAVWCFVIFFSFMLIFDVIIFVLLNIYYPRVRGFKVPQIVSNITRTVYFLGIVLFILSVILGVNIRQPFLTGSAIITAVIGLALQDTLGNLFAGLTLNISKPFDIGHWIKVGNIEGSVIRIEWRAITIKSREEDYVTIPNSELSKVDFFNFSAPTTVHGVYVKVGVRYKYPPENIKRFLIESALMSDGVIKEIIPQVFLEKYNDFSVDYRMRFYVREYSLVPRIRAEVMEKIWYVFQRNDVEIPFPIRDVYMKESKPRLAKQEMFNILRTIDFLQELGEEALWDIVERLKIQLYSDGELIIRQGNTGDTFYILQSGDVKVMAKNEEGHLFLSKDLSSGNFFGEISVLTGEPRSASIKAITPVQLLMLNKDDFKIILSKYPELAEKISDKIAYRQRHSIEQLELAKHASSRKEAMENAQKQVESLSKQILSKIKSFFSLK
ncbi:MAG: mechanosensitive ion channel [Candidatus Eremiobacteraeota bacterium]|nr:mechanosensitive ion channel [Candidatus Eremiobacteraeota bacterium]